MLYDDNTAGQTFELYGPKNYSTQEIAEMVDREIFTKRRHVNVPKAILEPVAGLLNKFLWWPVLSAEDVQKEFIDQQIDETAKTFADLGISPGDISNYTYHYLVSVVRMASNVLGDSADSPHSKDTEAQLTMIYLQQRRRRRERTGSISTLRMNYRGPLRERSVFCRDQGICHMALYIYTRARPDSFLDLKMQRL